MSLAELLAAAESLWNADGEPVMAGMQSVAVFG